jgi:hypothetical protein
MRKLRATIDQWHSPQCELRLEARRRPVSAEHLLHDAKKSKPPIGCWRVAFAPSPALQRSLQVGPIFADSPLCSVKLAIQGTALTLRPFVGSCQCGHRTERPRGSGRSFGRHAADLTGSGAPKGGTASATPSRASPATATTTATRRSTTKAGRHNELLKHGPAGCRVSA